MAAKLTVWWPQLEAPPIYEEKHCYAFSRHESFTACMEWDEHCDWIDYGEGTIIEDLLSRSKASRILVVTNPKILLNPYAVNLLYQTLDKSGLPCAPVFNQTDFASQGVLLPAPYVNLSTYREVSRLLSRSSSHEIFPVESLDPACVLMDVRHFESASIHIQPADTVFRRWISRQGGLVHRGAFIHNFGLLDGHPREDLVSLVPQEATRILDVGCAGGGYGKKLKEVRPDVYLVGIEINKELAERARPYYDRIYTCSIDQTVFVDTFDLINCGDVLEHLYEPWCTLKTFHGILRPNGYLVLSVPNVGHWSIVRDLVHGRFQYIPIGLLCISHIRWFTETSLRQALEQAGFGIQAVHRQQFQPTPEGRGFIDLLVKEDKADETSLLTNELIFVARKQ